MSEQARDPAFDAQVVSLLPNLRHHAMGLCQNRTLADDLVQETVVRALDKWTQFSPGTNLLAWMITIEKNLFYTLMVRSKRTVEDPDAEIAGAIMVPAEQEGVVQLKEAVAAVNELPEIRRSVFMRFWYDGQSQDEICAELGLPTGTVKSRVHRARTALAKALCE
jgi:RNA polymerase sigma-70 factor (ECF subfamily)